MKNRHDNRRDREFPPRWTIAVMVLLLAFFAAWSVVAQYTTKQEAQDASKNANALADQVAEACANGEVKVNGRNICTKANQVKKDVKHAEAGPAGPAGPRGSFRDRPPVPVRARLVFERDGEVWLNGTATRLGFDGAIFVELKDRRCQAIGAWLMPADVWWEGK